MTISFDFDQVKATVWRQVRTRDRERFPSFPPAFPIFPRRRAARPGPVKEQIVAFQSGFVALIKGFAATALAQHELPAAGPAR
jgi:hypothetical protein